MDTASRAKLLRLLGLGVRGRLAVVGVQQVRDAALRGKLALAVVAPDASVNSRNKVVPLLTARRIRFVEGPSAAELGALSGKDATAAIGVVDRNLAKGIREIVDQGPVAAREEGV